MKTLSLTLATPLTLLAVSCGSGTLLETGASPSGSAASGLSTTPVAISIDTARTGYRIPGTFVGISFPRENISGSQKYLKLFDPSANPHCDELVNLFREIGIQHIRILSGPSQSDDPDPDAGEDDAFFRFAKDAGLGDGSIIYSFHLFNEEVDLRAPGTSNVAAARHIWDSPYRSMIASFAFDNEPDWPGRATSGGGLDPYVEGYYPDGGSAPGYRDEWQIRRAELVAALDAGTTPLRFSGPDTGSAWPALKGGINPTDIDKIPFTLRFAQDEQTRIAVATQHYYGGSNTEAPPWQAGSYYVGDTVRDPSNLFTYRCAVDDPDSVREPHDALYWWHAYPAFWDAGASYRKGDYVQDPDNPSSAYVCVKDDPDSGVDPGDSGYWTAKEPGLLSALQMSEAMLDAGALDEYETLYDAGLAGAGAWPDGLRYRMTESNAFSGGEDPDNQIFALALWSLDYFHWWAARGALGVDPFTRVVQYNAPIFQTSDGFVAEPYAYGMRAFKEGSDGTTLAPDAVTLSPAPRWLTVYPVINARHLYVTLVNKTFNRIGAIDAVVTLKPNGFSATSAQMLVLASGGGAGDSIAPTATLGGATIPSNGRWTGTWTWVPVDASGTVGPFTVAATSAVVLDLSHP